MNRVKLVLTVLALVLVLATSANAATLLSAYNFEETGLTTASTTVNDVSTAPTATLYGSTIGSAASSAIGTGALTMVGDATSTDYVDQTATGCPTADAGLTTGSYSFWINSTETSAREFVVAEKPSSGGQGFNIRLNQTPATSSFSIAGAISLQIRSSTSSSQKLELTSATGITVEDTADTSWTDGAWHQITVTWNVVNEAGDLGSGSGAIYIDGTATDCTVITNTVTGSSAFASAWTTNLIGSDRTAAGVNARVNGSLDDVSSWNGQLTAQEVATLYFAGNSALDYSAADVQSLMTLYEFGSGSVEVNGTTWAYSATVAANSTTGLVLGASGTGGVVAIPEPTSLALLVSGLFGLVAYAWRKRK